MYLPIGGVGRLIRAQELSQQGVSLSTVNDSCLQPGLLTALLSKLVASQLLF